MSRSVLCWLELRRRGCGAAGNRRPSRRGWKPWVARQRWAASAWHARDQAAKRRARLPERRGRCPS